MKLWETKTSSEPITAIRLRHDYEFEAGDYLGQAAADDPIVRAIMPTPSHRTRQTLADACRQLVHYATRWGEIYTTEGQLQGMAIWLPPTRSPTGLARSSSALLAALTTDLEPDDTVRLLTHGLRLARMRRRAINRPHWHLVVLIAESAQYEEIAELLVAPILQRADQQRIPCFTATADPRRVMFFVQHGFKNVRDDLLTPLGPRVWSLVRDASCSNVSS